MKIAINAVSPFEGGGFNTYNKNLILDICKIDKKNDYFIFIDSKNSHQYRINQSNVRIIKKNKILNNSIYRLFWMQLIHPIELLYFNIDTQLSTMNIIPLALYFTRIKIVLVQHSNLPWVYPKEYERNLIKRISRKLLMSLSIFFSDKVICDTFFAKDELASYFPKQKEKFKVVYLGVDRNFFLKKQDNSIINHKFEIYERYFLCIASTKPYHRLIELIKGYEIFIAKTNESINLIIITNPHDKQYYKKIKDYISQKKLNIKIITGIKSENIPIILSHAEIYMFSSICEVFGLTNIEAMSCGIPVLTSNLSSIPEVCNDAAIFYNPNDPKDIENKITRLFYDKVKKDDLINKGNKRADALSWSKTAKQTLEIIEN